MATERMIEAFAASMAGRVVDACMKSGHVFSESLPGEPEKLREELTGSMVLALLRNGHDRPQPIIRQRDLRSAEVREVRQSPPSDAQGPLLADRPKGRPVVARAGVDQVRPKAKRIVRPKAPQPLDNLSLFDLEALDSEAPASTREGGQARPLAGRDLSSVPLQTQAPLEEHLPAPRKSPITRQVPLAPPKDQPKTKRGTSPSSLDLPLVDVPPQAPAKFEEKPALQLRQVLPEPDLPDAIPTLPSPSPLKGQGVAKEAPEESALRERIERSVTFNHIECLEDGRMVENLRRHLKKEHRMTPEQYLEKWGLPPEYPMVAPNHQRKGPKFSEFLKRQQERR